MKFGKVLHPETVDFTLPADHVDTAGVLQAHKGVATPSVYVGCAKWNRQDLKGFYPKGTRDELSYYSTQFNSIELNTTFYRVPSVKQVATWRDKTPEGFMFFPKITNTISHIKRLQGVDAVVDEFCTNVSAFEEKLGMVFLQMHDNFSVQNYSRLETFIEKFPVGIPLALELRNTEWVNQKDKSDALFACLKRNKVANIIVDTAGRRDLMHMRLTTDTAFIRFVGANHGSDYKRLDDWVVRLKHWLDLGLRNIYFFVHQNLEVESPLLAAYFIGKLNKACDLALKVPQSGGQMKSLW